MTTKIYSVDPIKDFTPITLSGHRDKVIGAWFDNEMKTIYTISKDGAICVRKFRVKNIEENLIWGEFPKEKDGITYSKTIWFTDTCHYFNQPGVKVQCAAFHPKTQLLLTGFSNGTFSIYEMPDFNLIHTLSISQNKINTTAINLSGDWIAFGSSKLGQLLVWEWQSESYVLKQQGHYYDVSAVAYSGDGQYIVTGGDDGKMDTKSNTGYCFITFSDHSSGITGVQFTKGNQVIVSSSKDGTVRAYDLLRYRNFRIFMAPTPMQFSSVVVDPSGEIVCAGSLDAYEICIWNMQTGKLLDILSGHEGPISSLAFKPDGISLASSSWDRTVRLWNIFDRSKNVERLEHSSEVLFIAYRPDGKQLSVSTNDGQIYFLDTEKSLQIGSIEGRKDIATGRKIDDKTTADNSSAGKSFTSLAYSADGSTLICSGNSKYICMYDIQSKVLIRKFRISHNLSLDGIEEILNSKNMTRIWSYKFN